MTPGHDEQMNEIPDQITDFEHRLTYAIGHVQRAAVDLRHQVEWFLLRRAREELGPRTELVDLVREAHLVVQLGDVDTDGRSEPDTLDDEAIEALAELFDAAESAALDIHQAVDFSFSRTDDGVLTPVTHQGEVSDGREWTPESINEVARRAIRLTARLHTATFLYGDFFADSRWVNMQLIRGQFAFQADGAQAFWWDEQGKPTAANGLEEL